MNQERALEILQSGRSALITGRAGSGKTYLLNQFIKSQRAAGKVLAITATTGLAATHLSGETIHRWAKIGIHESLPNNFFQKLTTKDRQRMIEVDILIIDEISMLSDVQFSMIDYILRGVRQQQVPFGGIQLVMSGDFFQLPPIKRSQTIQLDVFSDYNNGVGFVTSSAAFEELNPAICYLESQYRQSDNDLLDVLEAIRAGTVDEYELNFLNQRLNQQPTERDGVVTNLHTSNMDVDRVNSLSLTKINQPMETFLMTGSGNRYGLEVLKKMVLALEQLDLKIGAEVMAIKNDSKMRFVNGSLGKVTNFARKNGLKLPVVQFNSGKEIIIEPDSWELTENDSKIASVIQLPLRLAYAITIHKAQGMTLDKAKINLAKAFTPGMGYVALSRIRRLEDLYLMGINQMALTVSEEARQLDEDLHRQSRMEK
ncbi:MAG: PIF1 family ATP-dependent DNA helicase [Candidatus Saccharibacteria bacterium]|nr:PIF1 family ATP-dependent DNA helicase [Candidatus Saccharibacteria bacterium]